MLWIFMGKPGVGKSFAAKLCSEISGIAFLEGDSAIAGKHKILLTNGDVDKFVKQDLIKAIDQQLELNNGNLIVAYAFYRAEHRKFIFDAFKDRTDVTFIYVCTSPGAQNTNLSKRKYGCLWRTFAKVSQLIAFEPPAPPLPFETLSHTNAGKDELVNKLVNMTCYKKMVHPELPLAELKDAEVSKDTKEAANLSDCKKYVFFTVGAVPCAVTAYQAMRPRV